MTDSIRLNVLLRLTATFPLGFHVYGTSFAPNSNTTTMLCTAEFLPAPVPQILGLGHAGQHLGLSWWQFHLVFLPRCLPSEFCSAVRCLLGALPLALDFAQQMP